MKKTVIKSKSYWKVNNLTLIRFTFAAFALIVSIALTTVIALAGFDDFGVFIFLGIWVAPCLIFEMWFLKNVGAEYKFVFKDKNVKIGSFNVEANEQIKQTILYSKFSGVCLNDEGCLFLYKGNRREVLNCILSMDEPEKIKQIMQEFQNLGKEVVIDDDIQKEIGFYPQQPSNQILNSSGRSRIVVNDAPEIKPSNNSPRVGSGRRLEL